LIGHPQSVRIVWANVQAVSSSYIFFSHFPSGSCAARVVGVTTSNQTF
jgi:hypothetical protein